MHEMSIAQNISDLVRKEIDRIQGVEAVTKIRLKVGMLSGVVPDSLSFCFGFVTEGTPLERASLEIDEIPVRAKCRGCGAAFTLEQPLFICPRCGSSDLAILAGQELVVESIEVEEADV